MSLPEKNRWHEQSEEENDSSATGASSDAIEDDGTPVMDEEDLEENDLSVEEAEDIEWDEPQER